MSTSDKSDEANDVDPIDREAATIDARSEDARERIADLVEHADDVGRDVEDSPIPPADETSTEDPDD
jgi:hypothetical protein